MSVTLAQEHLSKRRLSVIKLFKPLVPSKHPRVFLRSSTTKIVVGLGNDDFGDNLRNARHASRLERLFLNYFEVWLSEKGGVSFTLDKAYLHIDTPYPNGTGDEEVLALHCDPAIRPSEPSFNYKRGPHFHISGNKHDIKKAHIALCLTDLNRTFSDADAFFDAFGTMIRMIDEELFPHLK